jgi:hypothetical protein
LRIFKTLEVGFALYRAPRCGGLRACFFYRSYRIGMPTNAQPIASVNPDCGFGGIFVYDGIQFFLSSGLFSQWDSPKAINLDSDFGLSA